VEHVGEELELVSREGARLLQSDALACLLAAAVADRSIRFSAWLSRADSVLHLIKGNGLE